MLGIEELVEGERREGRRRREARRQRYECELCGRAFKAGRGLRRPVCKSCERQVGRRPPPRMVPVRLERLEAE